MACPRSLRLSVAADSTVREVIKTLLRRPALGLHFTVFTDDVLDHRFALYGYNPDGWNRLYNTDQTLTGYGLVEGAKLILVDLSLHLVTTQVSLNEDLLFHSSSESASENSVKMIEEPKQLRRSMQDPNFPTPMEQDETLWPSPPPTTASNSPSPLPSRRRPSRSNGKIPSPGRPRRTKERLEGEPCSFECSPSPNRSRRKSDLFEQKRIGSQSPNSPRISAQWLESDAKSHDSDLSSSPSPSGRKLQQFDLEITSPGVSRRSKISPVDSEHSNSTSPIRRRRKSVGDVLDSPTTEFR